MTDERTCGRGLAEHAIIPAKLGELISALADNLEAHLVTLDHGDPNARAEREAYLGLIKQQRQIATALQTTAAEMAGYRSLPMASHDPRTMSDPEILRAFEAFEESREELLSVLGAMDDRQQQRLGRMRQAQAHAAHL